MAKEYLSSQMEALMKENGKIIKEMAKEYLSMQVEILMKENL